jgi:protein-S-isoprenylcysteine O-methyltransferase Ste14
MFIFLIPLLLGFACNSASAFTAAFARRWGQRRGQLAGVLLRDVLGIPLWVAGLGLAMRAPADPLVPSNLAALDLAWLLMAANCVIILLAYSALGWRAAAPAADDTLVEHGLYAHMRHPMYAALLLALVSLFLMQPTGPVALAGVLGIGWSVLQARLEELDLLQRLPAYAGYMRRVPGFVPRLDAARHAGPRPTGMP